LRSRHSSLLDAMARGHAASFAEGELFGEDVDLDFGSGKNAGFDWFRASSWPAAAPARLRPEPPKPPSRKPSTADWEVPPLELPCAPIPRRRSKLPVASPAQSFTATEGGVPVLGASSIADPVLKHIVQANAAVGDFDGDKDDLIMGNFRLDVGGNPSEADDENEDGGFQVEMIGFDDDEEAFVPPKWQPSAVITKRRSITSMTSPTTSFTTTEGEIAASAGSSLVVPVVEEDCFEAGGVVGDFGTTEDDAAYDTVSLDNADNVGGSFQARIQVHDPSGTKLFGLGASPALLSALEQVAAQAGTASRS